jgi:hypothetical protein
MFGMGIPQNGVDDPPLHTSDTDKGKGKGKIMPVL